MPNHLFSKVLLDKQIKDNIILVIIMFTESWNKVKVTDILIELVDIM